MTHGDAPSEPDWATGPSFPARYTSGRCARCEQPIQIGDQIAALFDDSEYVHSDCSGVR